MLQYNNDSAFYFFALSTISFYLIPSWYAILSRVYRALIGLSDDNVGAVSRTSAEQAKAAALKKEAKGMALLLQTSFLIHVGITLFFTVLFIYLIFSVPTDGEVVNSFDPFSILQIDAGADSKTIKCAYRRLSLLNHPDKNLSNPQADARFIMIAKAYEALTDETAMENLKKYGHPDGKQSLEVSIGLPSFLLDTANRNLVLMIYLVFMVGVISFCVWQYYSDSSKFGQKDVLYDTYSWFHHTLNDEDTPLKGLSEIMAGSAEFRKVNKMPSSPQEKKEIATLLGEMQSQMLKPKYIHPVCIKGNVLLHSYLLRKTDELSEKHCQGLKYMLSSSNSLVDAMIFVCQNVQTAMNCIEYGQYLAQACWVKDSPLLQLPHFTAKTVKHLKKGKGAFTIQEYRAIPDKEKRGLLADLNEQQKQDVFNTLKVIPDISVASQVYVDDDEDKNVYEGDLCTVKVSITRNNLKDGEKAGLVHAPRFPFPKQEAWWIILGTKEGKIISIEKVTVPSKVVQHEIKFLAPRVGEYEFDLHVKSNAYMGLDTKSSVSLTTLDKSVLPEYKVHPDDAELDDEPTLFEELFGYR